jgi:molybdopterin-containing oxidoreductase family iron-sulfur binding subunit
MEKCTFCIQRIHQANHKAKAEGREVMDGEFTTACAQACPSNAITFGRVDKEDTQVYQMMHHGQSHGKKHLEELGTLPNIVYMNGNGAA